MTAWCAQTPGGSIPRGSPVLHVDPGERSPRALPALLLHKHARHCANIRQPRLAALVLTGPTWAAQPGKSPVNVFILAGQSNMEGAGAIRGNVDRNGGKGSLEYLVRDPATAERFKHTVGENGDRLVRDDVWIWCLGRRGGLSAGYGARDDRIGPEFQFGHVIGDSMGKAMIRLLDVRK